MGALKILPTGKAAPPCAENTPHKVLESEIGINIFN